MIRPGIAQAAHTLSPAVVTGFARATPHKRREATPKGAASRHFRDSFSGLLDDLYAKQRVNLRMQLQRDFV